MTEVRDRIDGNGHDQIAFRSNVVFDASPNLASIVRSVMEQSGRDSLAERKLVLASRAMTFANYFDLQKFQSTDISRNLLHGGNSLDYVGISPGVEWLMTPDQRTSRLVFHPDRAAAVALNGLYAAYASTFGTRPYNGDSQTEQRHSQSLSYTAPTEYFAVSGREGADAVSAAMRQSQKRSGRNFYAESPRLINKPILERQFLDGGGCCRGSELLSYS